MDKETNTEDLFPEEVAILPKERTSRRPRGSAFVRSSTIVRSQTFSPGARSQYVCRVSKALKEVSGRGLHTSIFCIFDNFFLKFEL